MSRYPPVDEPDEEERGRIVGFAGLRTWLFLGMGLAGILTVALIVTADRSYAGLDGMRAVSVQAPESEQDPPRQTRTTPLLGGIAAAIRDIAPILFAEAPAPAPLASTPQPAGPSVPPPGSAAPVPGPSQAPGASQPPGTAPAPGSASPTAPTTSSPSAAPGGSPPPSGAATPAPGATPTPTSTGSATPAPTGTASPIPTGTATPTPTPSPTPGPTLAISTDRGATAIVNLTGLVPGDSMSRTIAVQNSGGLSFKYTVSATQTASTPLWTDVTYGLQLTVKTTGGAVLYSGPLSGLGYLAGPAVLAPGASETLSYTFDFPPSGPNALQGLLQDLTLVFNATQFP